MSVISAITALRDRLGAALRTEHGAIDRIRDQIAAIAAERAATIALPRRPVDIERAADDLIDRALADAFPPPLFSRLARHDERFEPWEVDAKLNGRLLAFAALVDRERLKAAMLAGQPTHGISSDERDRRVAAFDDRLLCLACAEEMALRALDEASNCRAERRDAADIAVILAPSRELETFAARAELPAATK